MLDQILKSVQLFEVEHGMSPDTSPILKNGSPRCLMPKYLLPGSYRFQVSIYP
jgi:hypothetical protein